MERKTYLITGATAGIGKESARKLAQQMHSSAMDAQLILVGRNMERLQATQRELQEINAQATIDLLRADLSSLDEVRRLAGEVLQRTTRLDVLLNNAGGYFMKRQLSVDGYEMTFALNHLSYFLLTNLLLELLQNTAGAHGEARVVNVSSNASQGGKIDFTNLQGDKGYNSWAAYAQSKLANILFTFELARRLDGSLVTTNALHPGFVATNFGHNNGVLFKLGIKITQLFGRTPEQGAETPVYLASSPDVKGKSGGYYVDCQPAKAPAVAQDRSLAERLWQVSAEMVGLDGGSS